MKWEIYNNLTPEQKEEYTFRFKKTRTSSVGLYSLIITLLITTFSVNMFLFYLTVKDPVFEQYKEGLVSIYAGLTTNVKIFSILIVLFMIIELGSVAYNGAVEYIWLKKNLKRDNEDEYKNFVD